MLRQNNAQEILEKIEKIYKFTRPLDTPVIKTLTTEAVAGASALTLNNVTSLANDDFAFVYGEEVEVVQFANTAATPPTVTRQLAFGAPVGAEVVKVGRADLGYIEEGGVSLSANFSQSPIGAANARSAIAYIAAEGGEMSMSFGLREANLRNVLAAYQIDESSLRGNGTSANPYLAIVGRDTIGSQLNHAYRGVLRLINGKTWEVDFLNCAPEVAISAPIGAKGQPAVWTIQVRPTTLLFRSW